MRVWRAKQDGVAATFLSGSGCEHADGRGMQIEGLGVDIAKAGAAQVTGQLVVGSDGGLGAGTPAAGLADPSRPDPERSSAWLSGCG